MRVFLCAFAGFSVAIPMDSVSSLMLYTNSAPQTVERNQQDGSTYVSLPRLFRRPLAEVRHGIVLKNGSDDISQTTENKVILLTTKVECEAEYPPEQIYPLPNIFGCLRFSAYFNGILFNSNGTVCPVLLLNTAQLVEKIQKESAL